MTVREWHSVTGGRRASARAVDVCFSSARGQIRGARNMVRDLWIHRRGSKPLVRTIHSAVATGHYAHVHARDPVQNT